MLPAWTMTLLVAAATLLVAAVTAGPTEELVSYMPSANFFPNFKHYSGFLNASEGNFLHYWLVESQRSPSTDPLLLWLNGGPGCSSMDGALSENGPFRAIDEGRTIVENVHSWNKIANVLYIESPVQVGWSYTTNARPYVWNDDKTSKDTYLALLSFLRKFPEFNARAFFISGESYAGVYIPTLAAQWIVNDTQHFPNFEGVAIGDGLLNYPQLVNSLMPMLYYHNIMPEKLYRQLASDCCDGDAANCNYWQYLMNQTESQCNNLTLRAYDTRGLDPYNLYFTCYLSNAGQPSNQYEMLMKHLYETVLGYDSLYETVSTNYNPNPAQPQCAHYNDSTVYLDREDVRTAFHIPATVPMWQMCNMQVAEEYTTQYLNVGSFVRTIMAAGKRVLIYNGDVDTVCNAVGNQAFVRDDLEAVEVVPNSPWTVSNTLPPVAGFVTRYKNVDFLTVRGAGHFVPQEKPIEALQMIVNFLRDTDYSKPAGVPVEPSCSTKRCSQMIVDQPWMQASLADICGSDNYCVSTNEGAKCDCMNGMSGDYCNEKK